MGYQQTQNFASPHGAVWDKPRTYSFPARFDLNSWALAGTWTAKKEAVALNQSNGQIAYRFHARDLNLVMGPSAHGQTVRFRVLLDGHEPAAAYGADIDDQGNGTIVEQRLYQLIRQTGPIADRQFEIQFLEPSAEAFDFTFG